MHVRAQWQCLISNGDPGDSAGVWADYQAEYNESIEAAWWQATHEGDRAAQFFEYSRRSFSWRIDTLRWLKVNKKNGTCRPIRRVLVPDNFTASRAGNEVAARNNAHPPEAWFSAHEWKPRWSDGHPGTGGERNTIAATSVAALADAEPLPRPQPEEPRFLSHWKYHDEDDRIARDQRAVASAPYSPGPSSLRNVRRPRDTDSDAPTAGA